MGCVPVNADGAPLRSCIIWADQRAQAEARGDGRPVRRRRGLSALRTSGQPGLLRAEDPVGAPPPAGDLRTGRLLPAAQGLRRLPADGSSSPPTTRMHPARLLFDLVTRDWHQPFLDALDLSAERLPALLPSTGVAGEVTAEAAAATGLAAGTPVVIGGGDGSCAGVGAGVIEPGDCYCYIGSSAWVSTASAATCARPAAAHGHVPPHPPAALCAHGHHAGGGRRSRLGVAAAAGW